MVDNNNYSLRFGQGYEDQLGIDGFGFGLLRFDSDVAFPIDVNRSNTIHAPILSNYTTSTVERPSYTRDYGVHVGGRLSFFGLAGQLDQVAERKKAPKTLEDKVAEASKKLKEKEDFFASGAKKAEFDKFKKAEKALADAKKAHKARDTAFAEFQAAEKAHGDALPLARDKAVLKSNLDKADAARREADKKLLEKTVFTAQAEFDTAQTAMLRSSSSKEFQEYQGAKKAKTDAVAAYDTLAAEIAALKGKREGKVALFNAETKGTTALNSVIILALSDEIAALTLEIEDNESTLKPPAPEGRQAYVKETIDGKETLVLKFIPAKEEEKKPEEHHRAWDLSLDLGARIAWSHMSLNNTPSGQSSELDQIILAFPLGAHLKVTIFEVGGGFFIPKVSRHWSFAQGQPGTKGFATNPTLVDTAEGRNQYALYNLTAGGSWGRTVTGGFYFYGAVQNVVGSLGFKAEYTQMSFEEIPYTFNPPAIGEIPDRLQISDMKTFNIGLTGSHCIGEGAKLWCDK